MNSKKILFAFLTVSSIGLTGNVFAKAENVNTMLETPTSVFNIDVPKEYIDYASAWSKEAYEFPVEISNITEILDINGNQAGYMISFECNETPAGYIITNLNNPNNPLKEYALEGDDLYDVSIDMVPVSTTSIYSVEKRALLCLSPWEYAVEVKSINNSSLFVVNGSLYDCNEFDSHIVDLDSNNILFHVSNAQTNSIIEDGMITNPPGNITSSHNLSSITKYTPLADSDFSKGYRNCKFVASTNIFNYFHKIRKISMLTSGSISIPSVYDATSKEIQEYRESLGDMPSALTQYMQDKGYPDAYTEDHRKNTAFSYIKNDIDNDAPVLIFLGNVDSTSGHAVVGCGYQVRKNGTSTVNYVRIMDGWNNNINRFIAWNNEYYDSIRGIGVYYE